ncbi:MAG TPA: 23S rRNA (adenine(2030)-N(6))-methyltransferase RlmJ [Xanthobacteraceae bacterium]|nr:23S rRNA (adenine(2030)-N(6))-methyltransferase RlmJ [Xanthobacteraceae bacterium]
MNYRHGFHAGNFADVVKHAVLARIVMHLRAKTAPFRVIDTHAGAGLYDLEGPEASRTGEWRDGIGRLRTAAFAPQVRELLAPYLEAIAAFNPPGGLELYPGSPLLVRQWLRTQDRLIACELEPVAAAALQQNLGRSKRVKTLAIDGWTALTAYVPPKERRGLVIVDPPFEEPNEFIRLAEALTTAHRKWPKGIYLLWYPIKDRSGPDTLAKRIKRAAIGKVLRAELTIAPFPDAGRLTGCGLIIVNPPWTLESEIQMLFPALARCFSQRESGFRLDWLAGEK